MFKGEQYNPENIYNSSDFIGPSSDNSSNCEYCSYKSKY